MRYTLDLEHMTKDGFEVVLIRGKGRALEQLSKFE